MIVIYFVPYEHILETLEFLEPYSVWDRLLFKTELLNLASRDAPSSVALPSCLIA